MYTFSIFLKNVLIPIKKSEKFSKKKIIKLYKNFEKLYKQFQEKFLSEIIEINHSTVL